MNFYASRDYLDAAAAVYFPGRTVSVEDVRFGGDVLRLLVVDGRPVTRLQFLDFHQPLAAAEICGPVRKGRYARHVVRRVVPRSEWQAAGPLEVAPFVDWSAFRTFDNYRNDLLQRHRGFVRDRERRWRSLSAAHGELDFTVDDRGGDVLPAARAWKSEQLAATGHVNWMAQPKTMEFLEALRERNLLVSSTLRAGGRLISLWLGFIYAGSWSGWVFAYDPAVRKYSAGHQLLACMLEESFERGHREFDFSEGAEDYKLIYATHARVLGDIGRPPIARAAVIFAKSALGWCSPKLLHSVQTATRSALAKLRPRAAMEA